MNDATCCATDNATGWANCVATDRATDSDTTTWTHWATDRVAYNATARAAVTAMHRAITETLR